MSHTKYVRTFATSVAALTLLTGLLAGCSTQNPAEIPAAPDKTQSSGQSTPGKSSDEHPWCTSSKKADSSEIQVTFGEVASASDEWAADLDIDTRHFIPMTVKNLTAKPCFYIVDVKLTADDEEVDPLERVQVALDPGQEAHVQIFDLDTMLGLEGTPGAEPEAKLEPKITKIARSNLFDYYDLDFIVNNPEGSGAGAQVPVDITFNAINDDMPERLWSANIDYVYLLGLDKDGAVVVKSGNRIDEPKIPSTQRVWFAMGGGWSGGYDRQLMPMSAWDQVETWELAIQPAYTDLDR